MLGYKWIYEFIVLNTDINNILNPLYSIWMYVIFYNGQNFVSVGVN